MDSFDYLKTVEELARNRGKNEDYDFGVNKTAQ